MSIAHLNLLKSLLETSHWKIVFESDFLDDENDMEWQISRPNGDNPLKLIFSAGFGGAYGQYQLNDITESIACDVALNTEIETLYFGKFSKKFQKDVVNFVDRINEIDRGTK